MWVLVFQGSSSCPISTWEVLGWGPVKHSGSDSGLCFNRYYLISSFTQPIGSTPTRPPADAPATDMQGSAQIFHLYTQPVWSPF